MKILRQDGDVGERAARNAEGRTYYVPADMMYKEWEEKFVNGGDKSGFDVLDDGSTFHWTRKEKDGKISPMEDITKEWTKKEKKGSVAEKQSYTVNGVTYTVDGTHVVLELSEAEKAVAVSLSEKYGKEVKIVPKVNYPLGVQTPDYLINGERFDLKSPTGRGKYLLQGLIAKKQKQSHNFVIDISLCPLSVDELERQVQDLFRSPRTAFLDVVVFVKKGEVVKVLQRKE